MFMVEGSAVLARIAVNLGKTGENTLIRFVLGLMATVQARADFSL